VLAKKYEQMSAHQKVGTHNQTAIVMATLPAT